MQSDRTTRAATEALFGALLRFGRVLHGLAVQSEKPAGGLSRGDVALLALLDSEGPTRASVIAERMQIGPSAVSRQVACLAQQGLLSRSTDPTDRRAELLEITESGSTGLVAARAAYVDRLTARLGEWDTKTLAEMAEQIERLCDSLATQPASPTGRKTHA